MVKKSRSSWDVTLPVFGVCYGKDNIDFRLGFMAMVGGGGGGGGGGEQNEAQEKVLKIINVI